MYRSARALALPLLLATLFLCACLPTRLGGSARFPGCTIPVFDATTPTGPSPTAPYFEEVSEITGMHVRWVHTEKDARFGVMITQVPAERPMRVMGSYEETLHGVDARGRHVVYGSIIRFRPAASAGIRRHELGHLFNLAHNPRSALMQPSPYPNADFSSSERSMMRAMAVRSGCR